MFYHFYIKISQFLIYVLHYALFILQNTINHPSYILFRKTGGGVNGKAERKYYDVFFKMLASFSFNPAFRAVVRKLFKNEHQAPHRREYIKRD